MPPTFFIFLGIVLYLLLLGITMPAAFVLFFFGKKQLSKKIAVTALASFPCLLITTIIFLLIFAIPGFLFVTFASSNALSDIGTIITIVGVFAFFIGDALSAIYLWYLVSKLFYAKIDNKSGSELFESDSLFIWIKPLLIKLHLFNVIVKWSNINSYSEK